MEEAGMVEANEIGYKSVPSELVQSVKSLGLVSPSILLGALFTVSIWLFYKETLSEAVLDTVCANALFILIFGCAVIVVRSTQFFASLPELGSKYNGDVERLFNSVNLNYISWLCIVVNFALFSIIHRHGNRTIDQVWGFGPVKCFPCFMAAIVVCQAIGLNFSTLSNILSIDSMRGVDYGTGMAYSYYYGYLQLILPCDGAQNPGLRHKMEQYESIQNVTIPVKKLFILIPESGYIPPDLKEVSDYQLESTTSLESEIRDRAGVKRRVYKNTVWKIHPGGDKRSNYSVYLTTEGATPLLTLWEILHHFHPQTAAYREHKREIIASFYNTLQQLIKNDPRCSDACELVYYKDYDENGKKVNVGEILFRRILQQVALPK